MRILKLKAARGGSASQAVQVFLVTEATIASWLDRIDEEGERALVQTAEPVNRFPEFVGYLVRWLKATCPLMGKVRIAQVLARAGLLLGATTVGRWYPIVLIVIGVIDITLVVLLPRKLAAAVRRRREEALEEIRAGNVPFEVVRGYTVALGLAEGWGLLGIAMHFLTREPLTLIAPVVAVPLILVNIPSLEKARQALE